MQWKRLSFYLLINVVVSAVVTLIVLTLWDRTQRAQVGEAPSLAGIASPTATIFVQPTTSASEPPSNLRSHQVRSGETLSDIALLYGVSVEEIMEINSISDPDSLGVGQVIYVPVPATATSAPSGPEPTQAADAGSSTGQIEIVAVVGVGDLSSERVVIEERAGGELSLFGWQLQDQDGQVFNFPQATLYENGAINLNTAAGMNTPLDLYWGLSEAVWESGEMVTLLDAAGQVQATYQVP